MGVRRAKQPRIPQDLRNNRSSTSLNCKVIQIGGGEGEVQGALPQWSPQGLVVTKPESSAVSKEIPTGLCNYKHSVWSRMG